MIDRFTFIYDADQADVQGLMIKLPVLEPIDSAAGGGYDPANLIPKPYKDLPRYGWQGLSSLYHGIGSFF